MIIVFFPDVQKFMKHPVLMSAVWCSYGVKTEFRRLFLPMMDYLQLLVVKSAFSTLKDGILYLWMFLTNAIKLVLKKIGVKDETDPSLTEQFGSLYVAEGIMSRQLQIDRRSWKKIKRAGKDVLVSMNEWGISPRVVISVVYLSNSGLCLDDGIWRRHVSHPCRLGIYSKSEIRLYVIDGKKNDFVVRCIANRTF